MIREVLIFVALIMLLCVFVLFFIAYNHQLDDSGFCLSCDEAIIPTVGILFTVSADRTIDE